MKAEKAGAVLLTLNLLKHNIENATRAAACLWVIQVFSSSGTNTHTYLMYGVGSQSGLWFMLTRNTVLSLSSYFQLDNFCINYLFGICFTFPIIIITFIKL